MFKIIRGNLDIKHGCHKEVDSLALSNTQLNVETF